jgi:hypothetical protein
MDSLTVTVVLAANKYAADTVPLNGNVYTLSQCIFKIKH